MLATALGAAAALVAVAFTLSTFDRWLARRRPHELAWSAAFACFGVASAALAFGAANGWNGITFRIFFIFGAILNVPILAIGTVYVHNRDNRARADRIAIVTLIALGFAAGVISIAPFRAPLPVHQLAQGSKVFGALPRVLAAVASGAGALVVIGGSVWTIAKRISRRLTIGNIFIALGIAITGMSGLLNSVVGAMSAFAITLVLGISVLFIGFLVAIAAPTA